MSSYKLELYVVDNMQTSQDAVSIIEAICKEDLQGDCDLEIIDIQKDPERAEQEQILAIPTLIKRHPFPERRLIGALTVKSRVLAGLGILS
ncbi:MAG: circadian clock KaiB family protein [Bacteroidota bacterium]|nr:circadian clock KaiB family protein [Bacteroidota bacterium]